MSATCAWCQDLAAKQHADCGQDGVCALAPGCDRHWGERCRELMAERDEARAEVERLRGVTPELPPFPPEGYDVPRYGIRWNGPTEPITVPMEDGYWTPWHLADIAIAKVERERDKARAELERMHRLAPIGQYTMSAPHEHEIVRLGAALSRAEQERDEARAR